MEQANLYAQQWWTCNWNDVTCDEIKRFLGILLGMGVHWLANFKLQWLTDPFFREQAIADVMHTTAADNSVWRLTRQICHVCTTGHVHSYCMLCVVCCTPVDLNQYSVCTEHGLNERRHQQAQWVSSFLTAHQHNSAIQCHSSWMLWKTSNSDLICYSI